MDQKDYVLGHPEHELQRLIRQGKFYAAQTEQFLRDAGIGEGMKVIDVGCGSGDVSLILAKLVGSNGQVVSFDKSPDAIEFART